MFTKSQLVATAVLVASASSVVASPVYNDVTDMEARGYTRDALTELKRRAVLEYLEELEARDPTGKVAGAATGAATVAHAIRPALANGGKSHHSSSTVSGGTHQQATGASGHHHTRIGQNTPAHIRLHTNGGKQTTTHRAHNQQHLTTGNTAHPGGKLHRNTGGHGGKVIKRSVLEYLDDLVGRAPTESTSTSGATKGSTHSNPASAKAPHPSTVTGAHKKISVHGHQTPNVVGGHKEAGSHTQHTSNAASAHKEAGLHTQHPSSHRHKDAETHNRKVSKHTTLRTYRASHPHGLGLGRKLRVHGLPHERTSILGGHKEKTGHDHRRLASPHPNSPVNHERVKTGEQRTSSSNTPATHSESHKHSGVASHPSAVPAHNQAQKQQTLKSREIEELAELIARELDLYDELD